MIVQKQTTKGASHAHITIIAQPSQRRIHQFQKRGVSGEHGLFTPCWLLFSHSLRSKHQAWCECLNLSLILQVSIKNYITHLWLLQDPLAS